MSNSKDKPKVIDFGREKEKRLVLSSWDRLEHEEKRERDEKRAEVERQARNQF